MNTKRVRELVGFLISMAALHDVDAAKLFADELEELIPKTQETISEEHNVEVSGILTVH